MNWIWGVITFFGGMLILMVFRLLQLNKDAKQDEKDLSHVKGPKLK